MLRPAHTSIDVVAANRHGQQLFIADTFRQKRPQPQTARPHRLVPWPTHYPVSHRQLVFFDAADRDMRRGSLRSFPDPPLPDLAAGLDDAVAQHAVAHGWKPGITDMTKGSMHILLGLQDTPGAPITDSETRLLNQLGKTARPVAEVLRGVAMFHDDRDPPLQPWFDDRTAGLPEPMLSQLRAWFLVLRDGSTIPPRSKPRNHETVRGNVHSMIPALHVWAGEGHTSLRDITRADIADALSDRPRTRQRQITSFRSLFRFLKARRITFDNPAARLRGGKQALNIPMPLDVAIIRQAINSDHPARAAVSALIAYHAPRVKALRLLQITDICDGQLLLDGRTIPLAAPVRERLGRWLDYRNLRWPHTANPHVFVSQHTAVRTTPVSGVWILDTLGVSPQALREDRILDELAATGGDVRRVTDLFGLTVSSAMRYVRTNSDGDTTSGSQT